MERHSFRIVSGQNFKTRKLGVITVFYAGLTWNGLNNASDNELLYEQKLSKTKMFVFFASVFVFAKVYDFENLKSSYSQKFHCMQCPNAEVFWSVFSHIRTEYGEIRSISPYSVRMRENMDQKKTRYLDTFHAVFLLAKYPDFLSYLSLCYFFFFFSIKE